MVNSGLKWFVRACALYNLSGVFVFLTPGMLQRFGVSVPSSPLWVWLPALMACFAAIVLFLSSFDLERFGSFPHWNGIVRMTFVAATFALAFGESAGPFFTYLAIGDIPLALGAIFWLPWSLGKSHADLLRNA